MERDLKPEWLDTLRPDDPLAKGSRTDLRRLNRLMGHARIAARLLDSLEISGPPRKLVDLGAGDGHLLREIARRLPPTWRDTVATLVDRHPNVTETTLREYALLGWKVQILEMDVEQYFALPTSSGPGEIVVANLFLHHFSLPQLNGFLRRLRDRADVFLALEPRRNRWAFTCSRLLWWLGCNRVTRHDAPVSVRAGFRGRDLSSLWPVDKEWSLRETRAGLFSHLFLARRIRP